MSDFRAIYETGAEGYDALVRAEDVDANLPRALDELLDLDGVRAVEIGAGTGRVTRILELAGAHVTATEPAAAMAEVAARSTVAGTPVLRAEAAHLPFADDTFELAIAGWVFAHQREWAPDSWRDVVLGFVHECDRVTAPEAPIVLIETLGTGSETPNPPQDLIEYYAWLEDELGFTRTWIRTDYEFGSIAEAARITGDFFGAEFAETVVDRGWSRVPECTGIWMRRP